MRNIFALVVCFILVSLHTVQAHNLWIETAPVGKAGKEHAVKVYLGGYGENERDSTDKWFANTKDYTLWLTEPGGTKKKLVSKAAGTFFEASFTPDKEGVYTLLLELELSEVYNNKKYQYHAAAQVKVGNSTVGQANLAAVPDFSVSFTAVPVVGKTAVTKTLYKGNKLEHTGVSVASPTGWVKGLETDKEGMFSFEPLWPGLYVTEVYYTEKAEGKVGEKSYTSVSHVATYSYTVGK